MPDHIYLSPHLDDVVLSCGGMIRRHTREGGRAVVVSVCAGDPPSGPLSAFAEALHQRWSHPGPPQPRQVVAARRSEDQAALRILGAEGIHLGVPDCVYRRHPASGEPLYSSEASLFGELHAADFSLVPYLAAKVSALARRHAHPRLYAPLGLGHHVDHVLVRRVADASREAYAYFEDFPYAAQAEDSANPGDPAAQRKRSFAAAVRGLTPEVVYLTEADLAAKIEAIGAYASQISTFWADAAAMAGAVRAFAAQTGEGRPAERVWRAP